MLKNYNEIMEKRADGLCENCEHGFDACLNEGKAFCTIDNKEVIEDGQENVIQLLSR